MSDRHKAKVHVFRHIAFGRSNIVAEQDPEETQLQLVIGKKATRTLVLACAECIVLEIGLDKLTPRHSCLSSIDEPSWVVIVGIVIDARVPHIS